MPPIIGYLVLAAILAACAKKNENEQACYIDTPQGKKPCGKDVVTETSNKDTDGDGVLDKDDKCPTEPHIGSPDGCALLCEKDTDSDGIKDCEDSCPEIAGIIEASGCTDATYGLSADYYRLENGQSYFVNTDSNLPCAHLMLNNPTRPSVLWANGRELKFQDVQSTSSSVLAVADSNDLNLCPIKNAVMSDSAGRRAVLWHTGMPGSTSNLYFQRFEQSGNPIGESLLCDSFPMPNLGPRGDFKIATLDMLPDDTAVVAWVNRDKVYVKKIPVSGDPSDRLLVNERSIYVESNINPDLSISTSGDMALVWQEGSGTSGPIKRAIIKTGQDVAERKLAQVAENGTLPKVSINGGVVVYLWEAGGIWFSGEKKNGETYSVWPHPLLLTSQNWNSNLSPSITLDNKLRMTASHLIERSDTRSFQLDLFSFANYEEAASAAAGAPVTIDSSIFSEWSSLAQDRFSASVGLLYPVTQTLWQVQTFSWAGTDAPVQHASISVGQNPVRMSIDSSTGRALPYAFHICNRGLAPLTESWETSAGFFISHDGVLQTNGGEEISAETCKVSMLISDLSRNTGTITFRTNDPNNGQMSVPISM